MKSVKEKVELSHKAKNRYFAKFNFPAAILIIDIVKPHIVDDATNEVAFAITGFYDGF